MEAVLLRTGSVPALEDLAASPRIKWSLSIHDRHGGSADFNSLKFLSRLNFSDGRSRTIRRAMSESDMAYGVEASVRMCNGGGSRSARILEEEEWRDVEISEDSVDEDAEDGVYGGGRGKGKELGEVDLYYKQMLKLNPMDPLLLRNYARFLYEVMKDTARADEFYGRAILANPGDGEVLGLYGKFIWETLKDCGRAKSYFDQAVLASPDNCMVMGMYAEFMWENEEDEEDEDRMEMNDASITSSAAILSTITAY